MDFQSLPIELFEHISGYLDQPSLLSLLLVSTALNLQAERRLYRTIVTLGTRSGVLRQLSAVSRLGKHVHTLDMSNLDMSSQPEYKKHIITAYAHMPNLRVLSLPRSTDHSIVPSPAAPFRLFNFQVRPSNDTHEFLDAVRSFSKNKRI